MKKKAIQGGYIDQELYEKLEERAAQKGLKPTAYIRMIVIENLNK